LSCAFTSNATDNKMREIIDFFIGATYKASEGFSTRKSSMDAGRRLVATENAIHTVWTGRSGSVRRDGFDSRLVTACIGFAFQVASAAGGRDCLPAPSTEPAAAPASRQAAAHCSGPIALCLALSPYAVVAERCGHHPARHDRAMTPIWVPIILVVEVAFARREAQGPD